MMKGNGHIDSFIPLITRRSSWRFLSCLILIAFLPLVAGAADEIKPGENLDLSRCIAIALKNHPAIKGAQGGLKASQSRVSQARSGYYPQADLSNGYSRTHPAGAASNLGSGKTSYDQYQSSFNLKGTLIDFGKTSSQVDVQSFGAEAARADLDNTQSQIVLVVKQAYYAMLQSIQSKDAYGQAVAQFGLHLDQAKKFYEVGTKPRIDVTNAEVDLSQAKLNLLKADNALRIARISLNNAMGVPDAPVFEVKDNASFQDYPIDLATALKRGYDARGDLSSATAKREAAERSIDLAQKGYYPVLSGNAAYGWTGQDFPLDKQWTVGAALNFPLFSGFLTRSQVEEARANLDVARANEEYIRQGIRFDVEQAFSNLTDVRERIVLTELTVKQARENRELAQGRYAEGVGNTIEVTDALTLEINAKTAHINALSDYHLAVASLEKAFGVKQ